MVTPETNRQNSAHHSQKPKEVGAAKGLQAFPGRTQCDVLLDDGLDQDKPEYAARVDEAENQTQAEDDCQHDQTKVLGDNQTEAEKKLGSMKVDGQGAEAPLKCRRGSSAAEEQTDHTQGDPAATEEGAKKQAERFLPSGRKRFNRRQRPRIRSTGRRETEGLVRSPGSVQSLISPAKPNSASVVGQSEQPTVFCLVPLRYLNLLLVDLAPLLALGDDKLFRFLERLINPLSLQQIAGLAGGHQVIHDSRATFGVRMDVIDGQDQPAFEIVLPVKTAVDNI